MASVHLAQQVPAVGVVQFSQGAGHEDGRWDLPPPFSRLCMKPVVLFCLFTDLRVLVDTSWRGVTNAVIPGQGWRWQFPVLPGKKGWPRCQESLFYDIVRTLETFLYKCEFARCGHTDFKTFLERCPVGQPWAGRNA